MKSTRLQLAVTFLALATSVGLLAYLGLPPKDSIWDAAATGDVALVRRHLRWGAAVNARDGIGRTPLHEAAIEGSGEVAQLLLDHGADLNARDDEIDTGSSHWTPDGGSTPLHFAALYGRQEVARLLLDCGANVNTKDNDGRTPLHWAAIYGDQEVARLLLDHGAEANAKDANGCTPLDRATYWPYAQDIADFLRSRGAVSGRTSPDAAP